MFLILFISAVQTYPISILTSYSYLVVLIYLKLFIGDTVQS